MTDAQKGEASMIKDGKGGANTNANGLRFEKDISLEAALQDNGYEVVATDWAGTGKEQIKEVRDEEGVVGYLAPKRALAHFLRRLYDVVMREVLSLTLWPDEAFFNTRDKTLHILEAKWQSSSGSVDEKIQTGAFKLHEYQRLAKACSEASGEDVGVTYDYILSDWFKQERYQDVLDYNADNGVGHYFSEVPLDVLGL